MAPHAGIILVAVLAALAVPHAAAEIGAEGTGYGKSVLVEITGVPKITSVTLWLPMDGTVLESAKAEHGWEIEGMQDRRVKFVSGGAPAPATFGIVTEEPAQRIFWKAELNGGELGTGTIVPSDPAPVREDPPAPSGPAMTEDSVFRIVPERPSAGSTIRVVGQELGAQQTFAFYIGSARIGEFRSGPDGGFVGTAVIPESQNPGRVDMRLEGEGGQREISLRIGEPRVRITPETFVGLTMQGVPELVRPGGSVDISGTGAPGGAVTASVAYPDGSLISTRIADVDQDGRWEAGEPVVIPADAVPGEYSAIITDGRQVVTAAWRVEHDETVQISPDRPRFAPGEVVTFSGTAEVEGSVLLTIEDPAGRELVSDVAHPGSGGAVAFKFPTTRTMVTGTYTLIAEAGEHKEFVHVGLGVLPSTPVNVEMDGFHYASDEKALLTLSGEESDTLDLLVVESSNNREVLKESVRLDAGGRAEYELDLLGYRSAVYSAIVIRGNVQSEEKFGVDLKTDPSNLAIFATKERYQPGEQLLITGNTMNPQRTDPDSKTKAGPPVCPTESSIYLVTVALVGPDGEIRQKETYADKRCQISDSTFRVPFDAEPGEWRVVAESGTKSVSHAFEVAGPGSDGMQISVEEGSYEAGQQRSVDIRVTGAVQTVTIDIVSPDGDTIETLQFPASEEGEVDQPWLIPTDATPGTYTFKATNDRKTFVEATFEIAEP